MLGSFETTKRIFFSVQYENRTFSSNHKHDCQFLCHHLLEDRLAKTMCQKSSKDMMSSGLMGVRVLIGGTSTGLGA